MKSLIARAASVRNEKNTALLLADAVMQMISLNFELEYILRSRPLHAAELFSYVLDSQNPGYKFAQKIL